MRTPEEQEKFELACYGCRIEEFMESVKESLDYRDARRPAEMCILSQLSDAQEEIRLGLEERACQTINRAKHMIKLALEGKF
jgi:hypothetical protein